MSFVRRRLWAVSIALFFGAIFSSTAFAQLSWMAGRDGSAPRNAVKGSDEPVNWMPICRAWYQNGVHPGKLVGQNCNLAWGDREVTVREYEVLAGASPQLRWVRGANGSMPKNPIIGGQEPGRKLAVCRASHNGGMHPGKIVDGRCQFGWGGRAVAASNYQVLALVDKPRQNSGPTGLAPMESSLGHLPGTPIFPQNQGNRSNPNNSIFGPGGISGQLERERR